MIIQYVGTRTFIVDLTVAIDVGLTDHLIDFLVRQLLTCGMW